eukprot:1141382-Pelagomonas_calceolata.AAC.1
MNSVPATKSQISNGMKGPVRVDLWEVDLEHFVWHWNTSKKVPAPRVPNNFPGNISRQSCRPIMTAVQQDQPLLYIGIGVGLQRDIA